MNIFIYSDESGVLDRKYNEYYVFGGVMFLTKDDRDIQSRKYIAAEKAVRVAEKKEKEKEVKAATISNRSKGKLYRSLNNVEKFGIVIKQARVHDNIFAAKKNKQRYLDWAFKMAVKEKFADLIAQGLINPSEVEHLHFFVDEHTTATSGLYELREGLEQEFKLGTWQYDYNRHIPPMFRNLQSVSVQFCNSKVNTLVRAADIVANHIYHKANTNGGKVKEEKKLKVKYHP